jgi:hypothetical protein
MSAVSAITVSSGYLRGRPLPRLGNSSCGSCSRDSSDNYVVLSISDSWGFGSIVGSDSIDSGCRYGLTTVDRQDIGPLGNLTVHVSPSIVSRSYSPSQYPA